MLTCMLLNYENMISFAAFTCGKKKSSMIPELKWWTNNNVSILTGMLCLALWLICISEVQSGTVGLDQQTPASLNA